MGDEICNGGKLDMDGLLSFIVKRAYANVLGGFSAVGFVFSAQSTYEKINPILLF